MTALAPFWPTAWSLAEDLTSSTPDFARAAAVLVGDIDLQRYIFRHRRYADARLLPHLIDVGMPSVSADDGRTNRHWPVLAFLENIRTADATGVATFLRSVSAREASVYEGCVEVALKLPAAQAVELVPWLTQRWVDMASSYFDARLWARVLMHSSMQQGEYADLPGAVLSKACLIGSTYELSETLSTLTSSSPPHDALLGALESALFAVEATSPGTVRGMRLDELDDDYPDDALSTLARSWIRLLPLSRPSALRAARLLGREGELVAQLGLRALRHALGESESDLPTQMLKAVASDDALLCGYATRRETLALLARHFQSLPLDLRARLAELGRTKAASLDALDRYVGRDILGALASHFGPTEAAVLVGVEAEMGPYRPDDRSIRGLSMWVGPQSPLAETELRDLGPRDILALMKHSPGPMQGELWGPSVEGLAMQLRDDVPSRPAVFVELMQESADEVQQSVIHVAVIDSLSGSVESLDLAAQKMLVDYLDFVRSWFSGQDGNDVRRAIAALLEAAGPTIKASLLPRCAALLEALLVDPLPDTLMVEGGATNPIMVGFDDPRSAAVRATTKFMRDTLERLSTKQSKRLSSALSDAFTAAQDPQVLAAFASVAVSLRFVATPVWDLILRRLQTPEATAGWSALFASMVSHAPPSQVDDELIAGFRYVVENHQAEGLELVRVSWRSVLIHLLSNYLFSDESVWTVQLLSGAFSAGDADARRGAIEALRATYARAESHPSTERVISFVAERTEAVRARRSDSTEASALANLLVGSGLPLATTAGLLVDLLQLGAETRGHQLLALLEQNVGEAPGLASMALEAFIGTQPSWWLSDSDIDKVALLLREVNSTPTAVARSQRVVDALGRRGFFQLEPTARQLYPV